MKKKERELALTRNGEDLQKYFSLNLENIPRDAEIQLVINGSTVSVSPEEPIVDEIMNNGYIFNRKTDGRFITAQTFKMLADERGWRVNLTSRPYKYQLDVIRQETERMKQMSREDDPALEVYSQFFSKNCIASFVIDYRKKLIGYYRLKYNGTMYKFTKRTPQSSYSEEYINYCLDILTNIHEKLCRNKLSYKQIHKLVLDIPYIPLPKGTTFSSAFVDAYKAKGGYYTLMNLIKFHGCLLPKFTDRDTLLKYIDKCFVEWHEYNELWRFHNLLVYTIRVNNFSFDKAVD